MQDYNNQMEIILNEMNDKMQSQIKIMNDKFKYIRTGIANPQILDQVYINYYNQMQPLRHFSSIYVSEGNQLHIKPFDNNLTESIKTAILKLNIGINPKTENNIIKLIFPKPSEEQRIQLTQKIKKTAEEAKIGIRNIRRQSKDQIKKIKVNQDLETQILKQLQTIHDKFIQSIDELTNQKNKELLKY
ncbi:MAG: ribosome-recycling factor [Pigeon pea little leaf phytoplasma]|uniref:Ribosome recycling factor n=2 Tax=Candidatus Phytoplasma fabacearum TaxID=2982628 RepID=A0ABU8ZRN8_9MOLU|nr:ribosome-recycling factor ['Bituminaria bituminosa' little leaf phytoplasma]MDV3148792.1 ribosome-recycling factor [Pigeon pea little leaf phytoplasma]MDO7983477.1 ribosome recycling factor ['Bituminaria bituminosa' little leaf phytoplasma]MDO8023896.1 ribosome recycling factor ['Bituminaria bituminosa' little leaf phytoplasma]MDO8030493.1 ribosome recycling factor ['Bituminaria bituminosa' little leaf phytoplasma]MDV3154007.1 ribosome-recycling factor [Pigeon pea little leaf phytoplasma]